MERRRRLAACGASLMLAGVLVSGCAEAPVSAAGSDGGPATVETIEGSDVSRVTLTERAVERIGLTTAPVVENAVGPGPGAEGPVLTRKIISYGAVIYDSEGATWAYTTTEPLVFIREPITVDYIEGDRVVLADGPTVGTEVVTVGAAELFGAELGIGQ